MLQPVPGVLVGVAVGILVVIGVRIDSAFLEEARQDGSESIGSN
jgi:hypothetical protein